MNDNLKVPPQVKEVENNVLGLMMQYSECTEIVAGILTVDCFYSTSNQVVFEAIINLHSKGRTPDVVSVVDELVRTAKINQAGGPYEVSKLNSGVTSASDIEGKCRRILEKYILRELIRYSNHLIDIANEHDADAFDVLEFAETKILDISSSNLNADYTDLKTGMVQMVKNIEEMQQKGQDITGIPTGYEDLDNITHGWQKGDFIVIAARPSVGKSAFALNLARNAATYPGREINVGLFSMEMSLNQLVQRIVSAQSEVWLSRIKTGRLEQYHMEQLITKGVMKLGNANIYIDDTSAVPMNVLRSKIRRMVMKNNVELIIIDYLQLIEGDKTKSKFGNREQEISGISRELKKLSKQLKIPIIALAQLSREVEKRAIKTPVLSDLRESGAIEQDADIVGFLYRPSKEERIADAELARVGSFDIAKHRDGELGTIVFDIDDNIQKWTEVGLTGFDAKKQTAPPGFTKLPPRDFSEPKSENKEDLPF